ncbi:MAG: hypothetical protein ACPGYY_02005 [Bacteroidia bacterium]
MKYTNKLIIAMTLLAMSFGSYADEWDPELYQIGKIYPGYIVSKTGDTTHGYIRAQSHYAKKNSNQTICHFYDREDDRQPSMSYKPATLKGYTIGDKNYESIPYSGGLTSKVSSFVHRTSKGAISMYNYYWYEDGSSGAPNTTPGIKSTQLFWKEGDSKVKSMTSFAMGFKKKFPEYIKEHKELASKVANKEKGYKAFNIYAIIEEYNAFMAEQ